MNEVRKVEKSHLVEETIQRVRNEDGVSLLVLHDKATSDLLTSDFNNYARQQIINLACGSLRFVLEQQRLMLKGATEKVEEPAFMLANIVNDPSNSVFGTLISILYEPFSVCGPIYFGGVINKQIDVESHACAGLIQNQFDPGRFSRAGKYKMAELNNGLSLFRVERYHFLNHIDSLLTTTYH